jgi:hypothetical protein
MKAIFRIKGRHKKSKESKTMNTSYHIISVNLEECKKFSLLTGLKQDWETCQPSNHLEHAARSHQSQVLKLSFFSGNLEKEKKGRFND